MYSFRTSIGPVDLAFTDRYGGVSAAPFAELNLAVSGPDDEKAKQLNHRILMDDFAPGDLLADLYQVHGDAVVDAVPGLRPEADGIVTTTPGITLMVRAADCVPVLLAGSGVVGAAHAGRKGMAAGVVTRTVERMRELGADQIRAWIGPSICGACYEVPADMRDDVAAIEPASASTTRRGTPAIDVAAGVRAQLERAGVVVDHVGGCTLESLDRYSFRRDGESAGRLAGIIRMAPQ
ncbi:laccase domain protein [Nocardioides baekrokdamisoli]|uniref:Laccase domain protein n=1 Tax=Nocardioides baekrokdamisoli TaxID=1804624 RepID=A0A3G9IGZ8_9ACTN|nr:polyphenol oxidase family protein [Nocardioides baekrokdamisoli]BBH18330.1 laccase domain protein [Nocardioides baekrokdamisoli]